MEKVEVQKILNERFAILASPTDCVVQIVFAAKKDGTLLFYVDDRRINTMITREAYPTKRMEECIDSL